MSSWRWMGRREPERFAVALPSVRSSRGDDRRALTHAIGRGSPRSHDRPSLEGIMKAVAVFPGPREVKVVEREAPRLVQPDQVRLRMLDIGICGTDKEICSFEYG